MGKASDNERLKLRATFFNNLSAGLLLTGFLIPYLSLFGWSGEVIDWVLSDHPFSPSVAARIVGTLAGMGGAFYGSKVLRSASDRAHG